MEAEQKGPRGFRTEPAKAESERELGPMRFGTFVLSLAASGMVHLGRAADPERPSEPPPPANRALANQTIDILEMLEQKTRGNLDPDEAKLLASVLHDLRMAYVELSSKQGS